MEGFGMASSLGAWAGRAIGIIRFRAGASWFVSASFRARLGWGLLYAEAAKPAVHGRTGRLLGDDPRFGIEQFFPPPIHHIGWGKVLRQIDEHAIVPGLRREQIAIQLSQFRVRAVFRQYREALARTGFDQRTDHQPVDQLLGAAAHPHQPVQTGSVVVAMVAGQTPPAFEQQAHHGGEMLDFVLGDAGHGHHPVLRRIGFRPAIEQLQGVGGGFALEVGVIAEQGQRIAHHDFRPGGRGMRTQRQLSNGRRRHGFLNGIGWYALRGTHRARRGYSSISTLSSEPTGSWSK
jgi:hypothetical protein